MALFGAEYKTGKHTKFGPQREHSALTCPPVLIIGGL